MKQIQVQKQQPRPLVRDLEDNIDGLVWDPILRAFVYPDLFAEPRWRHTS
jgi:hypothetical protein